MTTANLKSESRQAQVWGGEGRVSSGECRMSGVGQGSEVEGSPAIPEICVI